MRTTLAAALLLLTATPALAEADWVEVSKSDDGTQTLYIDRSSIRITGPIRRYWERTDYLNDRKGWKQDVTLFETNCTTGQRRILQLIVYKVDGTNESASDGTWKYVAPDTIGAAALDYVCGK